MRVKLTIILFVLNALAFTAIYTLEKKEALRGYADQQATTVLGIEIPSIERLQIAGAALPQERVLERRGSSWLITSPIEWDANYFAVQHILSQLQFIENEVSFSVEDVRRAGQTLADYGLEEPELTLTLTSGDKRAEFAIGQPTEIGQRIYILSPDKEQILVVNRSLLESISVDLEDLRSQDIFDIPLFEVSGLTIKSEAQNLTIMLAQEHNTWKFEAPLQAPANDQLVESALNELFAVRVQRFINPHDKKKVNMGFEKPLMKVALRGNNRGQTLIIGSGVEEGLEQPLHYYAQLEGHSAVFVVNAEPFQSLEEVPNLLRERQFFSFSSEDVTALDISRTDKTITLQKLETGSWQVLEKEASGAVVTYPADQGVMDELLEELKSLEALHFADDAPSESKKEQFGLVAPQRTVQLRGAKSATLFIGGLNTETGLLYALTKDAPFVYEVSPRILQLLQVVPRAYRTRVLEEQPESAIIQSVKVLKHNTGEVLLEKSLKDDTQSWSDLLKAFPEKEHKAMLTLLDYVRRFEVHEYLSDHYSENFDLDSQTQVPWMFELEATVLLPGSQDSSTKTVHFFLTERLGGTLQVGGSSSHDRIFSLKQPLVDALFDLLFEQDITPVDALPEPENEA